MINRHSMFDNISKRYDFLNNLISLGLHKIIKRLALKGLDIKDNQSAIDLCTGTGDIAGILSKINPILKVTGVDFSSKMLKIARHKYPDITFIESDCADIPFEENYFDICTMFFGYRNVEDKDRCLKEIYRVIKPNGQFLHLDFGKCNFLCNRILDIIILIAAKLCAKHRYAYKYLIKTKREFMTPEEVIQTFEKYGLKHTKVKNYIFGIISAQYFIKG